MSACIASDLLCRPASHRVSAGPRNCARVYVCAHVYACDTSRLRGRACGRAQLTAISSRSCLSVSGCASSRSRCCNSFLPSTRSMSAAAASWRLRRTSSDSTSSSGVCASNRAAVSVGTGSAHARWRSASRAASSCRSFVVCDCTGGASEGAGAGASADISTGLVDDAVLRAAHCRRTSSDLLTFPNGLIFFSASRKPHDSARAPPGTTPRPYDPDPDPTGSGDGHVHVSHTRARITASASAPPVEPNGFMARAF